jgi:RNA polymerase sigma-70 factor (ECF subfamily)
LNRAIALRQVSGPEAALAEVEELGRELRHYHLFHATRADLLRELGSHGEARAAEAEALELTRNQAERMLLGDRLSAMIHEGGRES